MNDQIEHMARKGSVVGAILSVAVASATLLFAGCSGMDGTDTVPSASNGPPATAYRVDRTLTESQDSCWKPLRAYCGESCPDYTRAVGTVKRLGASGCLAAHVGRCGVLRYTYAADGFVSEEKYFNAAGELVAVYTTTDALSSNSACRDWTNYGERIDCEKVVEQNYCASALSAPNVQ